MGVWGVRARVCVSAPAAHTADRLGEDYLGALGRGVVLVREGVLVLL